LDSISSRRIRDEIVAGMKGLRKGSTRRGCPLRGVTVAPKPSLAFESLSGTTRLSEAHLLKVLAEMQANTSVRDQNEGAKTGKEKCGHLDQS
jgi:hypothetical protein